MSNVVVSMGKNCKITVQLLIFLLKNENVLISFKDLLCLSVCHFLGNSSLQKKKKGFFSKLSFKIFHDFLLKSFAVDCAVLNFLTYEQTNNRKGLL